MRARALARRHVVTGKISDGAARRGTARGGGAAGWLGSGRAEKPDDECESSTARGRGRRDSVAARRNVFRIASDRLRTREKGFFFLLVFHRPPAFAFGGATRRDASPNILVRTSTYLRGWPVYEARNRPVPNTTIILYSRA